jgi:urease accessory protein
LRLPLSADDRTRLRGHRRSVCGRDLLLQLERGLPLQPGEWLSGAPGDPPVRVEAAAEPLLVVRASAPLDLLRAAYHLGNRHVALEVRSGELRLLEDSVLADLLEQRGLALERCQAPFLPEAGAYPPGGGHHHADGHAHGPDHDHGPTPGHHPTHG